MPRTSVRGTSPEPRRGCILGTETARRMTQTQHTKAQKIKASIQATRERRKIQQTKVYQLKLPHLSKNQVANLERAYLESKWLYNWLLEAPEGRLLEDAGKVEVVQVKIGEAFEPRELRILGSQIKQEIRDRLKDNLRALAQLKKRGHKVGKLKFKPFINSIPLKQHGVTYDTGFKKIIFQIKKL